MGKRKAQAAPVAASITEFALQADGTRIREICIGEQRIQVRGVCADAEPAAAGLAAKLHALAPLLASAPTRATPWGEGQFDVVDLGPGVQAALRVTPDGRVKLTIPGGELDVTEGGALLGCGLHEAGARAAQIRVAREERRRKRAARGGLTTRRTRP